MISSAMRPVDDPRALTTTLAAIVAEFARTQGDAIAVADEHGTVSYAQLASWAAAVAAALPGAGPVGILLPASRGYVAAILGLLARGIAYVPMDESFPAARNADIAARAELTAVIVDAATAPAMQRMAPELPHILLPPIPADDLPLTVTATPDDVAVIFYTSGSTGQPKGVYQDQRGILYEVLKHCWRAGLVTDDRIALLYSPSVSGSTRDLYGSLAAGARLCVVDVRRQGLRETTKALAEGGITVLHSIPGVFRSMFASPSDDTARLRRSVRLVHLISDRVLQADVDLYKSSFARDCRLCIDLATTETYSYASWYLDHDTVVDRPLVPVGYPRADKLLRLVDGDGKDVRAGELGEIIVTGRSLSLGYWRDDAMSAERFAPSAAGGTEYRTGDMGRILPGGLLEFAGRKDRQVKVRGNTVHLAEVEAAVAACPGVAEAGAVVRGAVPDIRVIVYCAGTGITRETVAAWCAERLAAYMRPSEIVVLDALPRLPSGKPDAVGLEQLDRERAATAALSLVRQTVTATAAMRAVCDGWEKFLAPGTFDRDTPFAQSGGDASKQRNLLAFLESGLSVRLPSEILDSQTRPSALINRLTALETATKHRPSWLERVRRAFRR